MVKIKCYYNVLASNDLVESCSFSDNYTNNLESSVNIYKYFFISLTWDLYISKDVEDHLNLIRKVESEKNSQLYGGGQNFTLRFYPDQVEFLHNEFDEEDGFPDLSCPLSVFKTVLTAWDAFLRLPKNIHSVVETEIPEWRE